MSKVTAVGATALFACVLCAAPVSLRFLPEAGVSLSANTASAEIGRPLTATSVAGVHRRHVRRAYRRGYYGYGENYQPYSYGYGTRYGYGTYQPYAGSYAYGSSQPWFGFSSRPWFGAGAYGNGYGYGYGNRYYDSNRHWTEF
jgi:hypothetical protein